MFVASLEFLMLILIMPAMTAGSISGERERQTLDLMLTTCMTPADIVLGKLEAALGTMFLMVVSSLPILAMVFVYGGVTASESKLPAALERTLNTFSFKRVVLCFDNDAAGQTAARRIFTMLRQQFSENLEVQTCVPKVKDFNDQLCVKLQNGKNSPSRGTRESTLSR